MLLIELVDGKSKFSQLNWDQYGCALKMLHKTNNTEKAEFCRFSLFNLYIILSNGKENYRETGWKFINQYINKFEIVFSYRLKWRNMLQLVWETIIRCDIQPRTKREWSFSLTRTYDVWVPTGFDSGPYVICEHSAWYS